MAIVTTHPIGNDPDEDVGTKSVSVGSGSSDGCGVVSVVGEDVGSGSDDDPGDGCGVVSVVGEGVGSGSIPTGTAVSMTIFPFTRCVSLSFSESIGHHSLCFS